MYTSNQFQKTSSCPSEVIKRLLTASLLLGAMRPLDLADSLGPTIILKENPSTGYVWSYTMDKEGILKETYNEYKAPKTSLAGAPGMHVWQFEPVGNGTVTLTFTYSRPWEKSPEDRTIEYRYLVKDHHVQLITPIPVA